MENHCGCFPETPYDIEIVHRWGEMHGVARMLRGMAFECLFKALFLKYGGQLSTKGKYRGIPNTKDHDLCSLEREVSKLSQIELNTTERRMLARLSFFIVYGRYPIRRSFSEPYPESPDVDKSVYWCRWTPEDKIILYQLETKLRDLIDTNQSEG